MTRVLVVDDDEAMCAMLRANLARRGFDVATVTDAAAALARLRADELDVVVTDLHLRGGDGLALCGRVVADRPDLPVIVITAFGSLDAAIGAIRAGAYDFVPKPFQSTRSRWRSAAPPSAARCGPRSPGCAAPPPGRPGDLVGESPAIEALAATVARLGESDATVLVTGESGAGKEVVARALHRASRRAEGPFVAINCAALPEAMLESELFGHVRGAFTDARTARAGLFVAADGGTLLLDELGELPPGLQAKLLRALQERRVRPLGAEAEVAFDARVIAATHRDLEAAVRAGTFREDLYYRIDVVRLEVPPLRARGNDVLLLAHHFLARAAAEGRAPAGVALSPEAAARLLAYPWPGNVRELANCLERAVALARGAVLVPEDLPAKIRDHQAAAVVLGGADPGELVTMDEVERRYVARVMEAVGGNKAEAARVLGFDRATLYRKLERYRTRG